MILLAAFVITRWVVSGRGARLAVWAAALVAVGLIGFSRLYLGVHYPTDVAAGWLLGAAWAVVIALATAVWDEHPRSPQPRHRGDPNPSTAPQTEPEHRALPDTPGATP